MALTSCPDSRAASFSRCGRYRWWLRRRWRNDAPTLIFLGLNPSSADGRKDDPTLRRLIGLADGWGYGAIEVLNLFAWISADPKALRQAAEPVGSRTDAWIRRRVRQLAREEQGLRTQAIRTTRCRVPSGQAAPFNASGESRPDCSGERSARSAAPGARLPLWLGWGNGGGRRDRDQQVLRLLQRLPVRLFCLGLTASGQPRHPLYARAGSPLLPFGASWEQATAPTAAPCPAPRAATRST
jgi:hypothetical protein